MNFAAICKHADRKRLLWTRNTVIRVITDKNIIYNCLVSVCWNDWQVAGLPFWLFMSPLLSFHYFHFFCICVLLQFTIFRQIKWTEQIITGTSSVIIFIGFEVLPTILHLQIVQVFKSGKIVYFLSPLIRCNASVAPSESRLWSFGIWCLLAVYWSWAELSQVSTGILQQAARPGWAFGAMSTTSC